MDAKPRVSFKGGDPDFGRSDLEMGLCEVREFKKDDPPSVVSSVATKTPSVKVEDDFSGLRRRSSNAWRPRHLR